MNTEQIEKIALLKEQNRDIVENCEKQERSLNEEEIKQFEDNEAQIRSLEASETKEINQDKTTSRMNFKENLAMAMRSIATNTQNEDVMNVYGNQIQLRANETVAENIKEIQGDYAIELLEPLQDAIIVNSLGIRVITTPKAVVMPSVNNVEASIEGETTELVGQKLNFTKTKVSPFRIGLSLPFSNTAIKEADLNLVNYALQLCGKAEAQLINKIMFSKEAVNDKKGCFVDAYAAETGTTAINFKNIVKLAAKVKKANVANDGTAAYVVSPDVEAELKTTPLDAGSGRFVLENGVMNGYPVLVSNAVEGYIGFGVFSNFIIQKVGTPDMVIDNLSRSKENISEVNFNDNIALQIVRPEAFAVMKLA